jgi:nucleoside-specific outer membrane channel protein Tsx
MKKLTAAALGLVALAAIPLSAANWSDVFVGYQYSNQFRDPGLMGTQVKNRLELSGAAGWDYGTNFFDVNMLAATKNPPANTTSYYTDEGGGVHITGGQPAKGVPGNTEVYVVYRSSFDLGKIFKTNMGFGPVREVDFTVGFDFDSQDNQFASNKKLMMAGFQFGFNVSHGFWNLGIGACREANYNGVVQQEVDFKTQAMLWTAWHKGFELGVPVTFKGWANFVSSKGKDGFAELYKEPANTKPEIVGDMYLMFDVSRLFGHKNGAVFIGPGFEYWNNKFGGANVSAPASTPWLNNERTTALMLSAEIHF